MKQETLEAAGEGRSKRVVVLVTIAFLIGFGLAWFIFGSMLPQRNAKIADDSQPLVLAGKNEITIDDQLFGDSVILKSANLANDSWIAIHEDLDGKPGNILGAAWFPQGISSGAIELQRATVNGGIYYAMLHEDKQIRSEDGSRLFDYKIDTPMTDESGDPIMVKFMTTANPAGQ